MRCNYCGYEDTNITRMADHMVNHHELMIAFNNVKVTVDIKYFYCEACQVAFNSMQGEKLRTECPKCHSFNIVAMGGSFKRVKGIYFNPSER